MNSYYLAIYIGAFFTVIAQLYLKKSALRKKKGTLILRFLNDKYLIIAYILFLLVTLLTFYGLQKVELVYMVIIQPLILISVIISSIIIYKEKVSLKQFISIIIIIIGIISFNL